MNIIIDKLPSGGTWWELSHTIIQHENTNSDIKREEITEYNNRDIKKDTNRDIKKDTNRAIKRDDNEITGEIIRISEDIRNDNKKEPAIVVENNDNNKSNVEERIDTKPTEMSGNNGGNQSDGKCIVKRSIKSRARDNISNDKKLFNIILCKIDDLMELYTDTMKKHAEQLFIQEVKLFITEKCINRMFTLGKIRTIMNWLNGNKIPKTSLYVIVQFINWLLSDTVIDETFVELKYQKDELFVVDKTE